MTVPDTTATPEPVSSASSGPSLGDSIGEMLGDYRSDESPEPSTSAAGTTPAEPASGAAPETTDGTATPGDAATAVSDGTTPTSPATPAAEDLDPFADTTPATFIVNGKPVTTEDIRVFKEGGAVIRPESLPNVLSKLAERDTLAERVRTRDTEYQTLAKVTEWTDPTSKTTYSGTQGAIEMRIANAGLFAENSLIVREVINAEDLQSLLTTKQVPDGNGGLREVIIFRPDALEALRRENALTQREAANAVRDHYKTVVSESSRPTPAPIDYATTSPLLVAEIAKTASLDASVLTPADRAMLAKQLPFHIKDGLASLEWQDLVKDRIADRAAQKASSQSLVSTTEKALKEGQLRMAAAARGVKPKAAAPVVPVRTPSPTTERQQNEGDAWDIMERAGAAAMRQRA